MQSHSAKDLAGRFIVFDGPDASGKTTQLDMLAHYLESVGQGVITAQDPGGTDVGNAVRNILLSCGKNRIDPRTELLLYTAARLQLWLEKISPSLEAGHCVICDRWVYSTCAYQGIAGQLGVDAVYRLTESMDLPWPDKAVILNVEPAVTLARLSKKREQHELLARTIGSNEKNQHLLPFGPDRMESKPLAFHQAVRAGYLAIAKRRAEVTIVDASGTIEQIQQAIRQALGM